MKYSIFCEHQNFRVDKTSVRSVLRALQAEYPLKLYKSITVAFLSAEALCGLHKRFLNDPSDTDVITFPADETDPEPEGEICVSIDRAERYAAEYNLDFMHELLLYVVHGWLHLYGYNDLTPSDCAAMRLAEKEALQILAQQGLGIIVNSGAFK